MKIISEILIAFVALIHIYILWLEMFAWTTRGKKTFKSFPEDLFERTKGMAANQGLYNGFLAAGLIWSLCLNNSIYSAFAALFFLSCISIAGIFGAITVQRSIFFIQTLPALIGILFVCLS